jgi:hypothetical protein
MWSDIFIFTLILIVDDGVWDIISPSLINFQFEISVCPWQGTLGIATYTTGQSMPL